MPQQIDAEFEKTRNLGDAHLQCAKCHYKFKSNWLICESCGVASGAYRDFKTDMPIAQITTDPKRHANCNCKYCLEDAAKIKQCKHDFLPIAGGVTGCIKQRCRSSYVTWLNYVPRKYTHLQHLRV